MEDKTFARYSIKWTFSTPLASHHNGAVESLIKPVKKALNKVVKERVLKAEAYRTFLSEITTCSCIASMTSK